MGGGCPSHQSNLAYCSQCDATYYVAANEFSCQPCSSHCYACTSGSVCTTCLATFIKVTSGSSVTCGCNTAGQYFYDSATGKCKTCTYFKSHCQTCSLSGSTVVCSTCSSGYALAAGVCQPCPINCVSCAPTTLLCTTCSSGYALVGVVCQLCPTNCTSCAATTLLCITCVNPSYTLNSGVCSCD
jgi:proprotein convertase subtilisin/kexin type 5